MEDLWCKERCDDTLRGNQQIESAIAAFSDDQTEEHYGRVLQAVLERSQQNGNLVIPVERVGETVDGDKRVEQFGLQTIELHTGRIICELRYAEKSLMSESGSVLNRMCFAEGAV